MTREKALEQARFEKWCNASMRFAIYRVGAQWMITARSQEWVQSQYKIKIKDWYELKLTDGKPCDGLFGRRYEINGTKPRRYTIR